MAGLTGKTIKSAYKSLLRVDDNANGIDSAVEAVTDGEGTKSALYLSDDNVVVFPSNDDTTSAFRVKSTDGTTSLTVDTTNHLVKAGGSLLNVHTHFAYFHMNADWWASTLANTHYPLAFNANGVQGLPAFGTGTAPATTFTTAEGSNTRAGDIVRCMWYIPNNIVIDAVTSIEGADAATGETTRMHLMSYTFNSGSTSALASGAVVAYNSDQVNAGSEQAYLTTWTVDTDESTISAGKVILAFLRSDSVNSDYSANVYIKYHLV